MHINIARQDVDTVLLDMDGTLLDPHSITISGKTGAGNLWREAGYLSSGSSGLYSSAVSCRAAYAKLVLP